MFSRLNNNLTALNVHCVKQIDVMDKQTRFADYLRNVMKRKGLSYGDIVRESENGISKGRLSQILAGQFTVLKSTTIYALAKGIDEDPEQLLKMLEMGKVEVGPQSLIAKQIELPREVWEFIESDAKRALRSPDDHVRAILGAYSNLESVELGDIESVRSKIFDPPRDSRADEKQTKAISHLYIPAVKPESNTSHTDDFMVFIGRIQAENPDIDPVTISTVYDGLTEGVDESWLEIIWRNAQYYTPLESFGDNEDKSAHK